MGAFPPVTSLWPQAGKQAPSSQPSPLPNWFQYEQHADPAGLMTDEQRDQARTQFFDQAIAPWGMQQGHPLEPLRQTFMKQTEREGKSEHPRLAVVARSAVAALTAPMKAFGPGGADDAEGAANRAVAEAQKQGISPGPYQMAGEMAGQAPYWMAGMGTVGKGLEALGISAKVAHTAAGAVIQGTYDAMSAPAGTRNVAGFKGAATGAGMMTAIGVAPAASIMGFGGGMVGGLPGAAIGAGIGAGFDFAGPMWKFLVTKGVATAEARAVERVAQGIATPTEHELATKAILENPLLDDHMKEYIGAKVKAASEAGVPQDTAVAAPNGRIHVQMKGADGKPYLLGGITGMDAKDTAKVIGRIADHLKAGGTVDAVNGDPAVVHHFMSALEGANPTPFELQVPEGGATAGVDAITHTMPNDTISGSDDSKTWQARSPHGLINSRDSVYHATNLEGFKGILESGEIRHSGTEYKLENPEDPTSQWQYSEVKNPNSGVSVSRVPRLASKNDKAITFVLDQRKMPPSRPYVESDYGKVISDYWKHDPEAGQRNPQFEFENRTYNEPVGLEAVKGIIVDKEALGQSNAGLWDGKSSSARVEELLPQIQSAAAAKGIPVKVFENGTEVHAYRSGLSRLPEDQWWAQGGKVGMGDVPLLENPRSSLSESNRQGMYQERRVSDHLISTRPFGGDTGRAITFGSEGQQPLIKITPDMVTPEMVHHEMIHAHVGYNGMHDFIGEHPHFNRPIVHDMFNGGLTPDVKAVYGPEAVPEETFAYLSGAIRGRNTAQLQAFVEADTDKPTVLKWYTDAADVILDEAATKPDNLHTRTLERRLNYTKAQAARQLSDVGAPFETTHTVDFDPNRGLYSAEDLKTGETFYHHDREALLTRLEPNQAPLNAPELVDTSNLPPIPRYARRLSPPNTGRAPLTTDPPPPPEVTDIQAGTLALSSMFRPFYEWADSVGKKFGRPDLPMAAEGVRDGWNNYTNAIRPYANLFKETIAKPEYDGGRRKDFYKYIEATTESAKQDVATQFHFTAQELADARRFDVEAHGIDGLHEHIQTTIPEMQANGWDVNTRFQAGMQSGESVIGKLMRQGRLDPRDQDLLKVSDVILRGNLFRGHVKDSIDAFEKIVDEESNMFSEGRDKYTFGLTRPAMRGQIEFWRGQPDFTQRVVFSAMQQGMDIANKGIEAVNAHLPESMQLDPITEAPRDALGKFILYNYAGALGLRPSVPIRDMLGYYLTSAPLLGGKYTWKGMEYAFSGKNTLAYQEALENGWLLERYQLPESVAGGAETTTSQGGKWVNKAMSAITYSQNVKRIAAGHGFAAKIGDALEVFAENGDQKQFLKDSGMWFLNDTRQQINLTAAALAANAGPEEMRRFSLRAAKDLVDATQWDYQKGAAPGLYKYQLGRLFGQYGTWPMNYIEYARKFVTRMPTEYRGEAIKSLSRLVIAHGAVLSAAQNVGIDASHWVFTQPMAYGGGPLYQAITNIPGSMDFETYKGAEARRQLIEPIWPGLVPGGNEAHNIWRAVTEGDSNAWIKILGFTPMEPGEASRGLHQFVP